MNFAILDVVPWNTGLLTVGNNGTGAILGVSDLILGAR